MFSHAISQYSLKLCTVRFAVRLTHVHDLTASNPCPGGFLYANYVNIYGLRYERIVYSGVYEYLLAN